FKPAHATAGENLELRTLFFKLSWLLSACILPIFVFDGPLRPSVKRGKNVIATPHWLTEDFQQLINAFGFYSHQAPGEAEAELAQLNAAGLIDAIATDDSDVFVFGATHVICSSLHSSNNTDNVTVYALDKINSDAQVLLTREDMILIALLVGGDYDPVGLPGCGMTIAHKLVRACPLGHQLVHGFLTRQDVNTFSTFLNGWRSHLRNTLSTALLGRQFKALANSISEDFPQVPVLQKYLEPITSWSTVLQPTSMPPLFPLFTPLYLCLPRTFPSGPYSLSVPTHSYCCVPSRYCSPSLLYSILRSHCPPLSVPIISVVYKPHVLSTTPQLDLS
ncbi:PIN domain-like protein, partial [Amanita muscaria]